MARPLKNIKWEIVIKRMQAGNTAENIYSELFTCCKCNKMICLQGPACISFISGCVGEDAGKRWHVECPS